MGQVNSCVETINPPCGGGEGDVAGGRGVGGEGVRSHICRCLLYAWC